MSQLRFSMFRGSTKTLYCLPLVYLIGFAKSGTSDLHKNIIQHQHIVPGKDKESQFWHKIRQVNQVYFSYIMYILHI